MKFYCIYVTMILKDLASVHRRYGRLIKLVMNADGGLEKMIWDDTHLNDNWTTNNNGYSLFDDEVQRYLQVVPSKSQLRNAAKPFYAFLHFGMNTATDREWGNASETVADFTIKEIDAEQWIAAIKGSGATGVILTCKHHDGFCLWDTKYTDFSVMNSPCGKDIVRQVADVCKKEGMDFGIYLSPWDMHEKTYATSAYNDYFCNQLIELLSCYGEIFEVWFDGAKGAEAREFDYDWGRYYEIVKRLQPNANISICGPDLRWVGNEAGKTRAAEFSVVPEYLTCAEIVQKNSQHSEGEASELKKLNSKDEDLGSRKVLQKEKKLHWYPAEVDVSIRKGWFHHESENGTVKSAEELFDIYLNSVGNNCSLLLNVPPSKKGVIHPIDVRALCELGEKIGAIEKNPILVEHPGELSRQQGHLEYQFGERRRITYCVLEEDITKSQRVEAFDLYLQTEDKTYQMVYSGTVIGSKKIIKADAEAMGAVLVIRQSRSVPCLSKVGYYE